jgi:hypothetical protein
MRPISGNSGKTIELSTFEARKTFMGRSLHCRHPLKFSWLHWRLQWSEIPGFVSISSISGHPTTVRHIKQSPLRCLKRMLMPTSTFVWFSRHPRSSGIPEWFHHRLWMNVIRYFSLPEASGWSRKCPLPDSQSFLLDLIDTRDHVIPESGWFSLSPIFPWLQARYEALRWV